MSQLKRGQLEKHQGCPVTAACMACGLQPPHPTAPIPACLPSARAPCLLTTQTALKASPLAWARLPAMPLTSGSSLQKGPPWLLPVNSRSAQPSGNALSSYTYETSPLSSTADTLTSFETKTKPNPAFDPIISPSSISHLLFLAKFLDYMFPTRRQHGLNSLLF